MYNSPSLPKSNREIAGGNDVQIHLWKKWLHSVQLKRFKVFIHVYFAVRGKQGPTEFWLADRSAEGLGPLAIATRNGNPSRFNTRLVSLVCVLVDGRLKIYPTNINRNIVSGFQDHVCFSPVWQEWEGLRRQGKHRTWLCKYMDNKWNILGI